MSDPTLACLFAFSAACTVWVCACAMLDTCEEDLHVRATTSAVRKSRSEHVPLLVVCVEPR